MKKLLFSALVLIVLALPGVALAAAVTGNGTCAVSPSEAIQGQKIGSIAFTVTIATNNMDGPGNVHVKWPSAYGVPTAARVALSGTATEAKKVVIWSDGGQYYVGCTATADVDQTIIFTFSNMTITATAGSQTFTWSTADDAATTYTAAAIASQPVIYAWSANKAAAVGTVGPSPIALVSDTTNFSAQMVWSVSPVYGAQVRWQMSVGTPGYTTTPNPLTFAASTTNAKNNAVWIKATPGSFDTPVCNATECYANILAAATISIGDKFEIRWGPPTVAATVTPWHGSNYVKNMKINIKVNAANPATTETPVTYPTAAVSGNFLFTEPTPTIVLTVTANADGSYNCYGTGPNPSLKWVKWGTTGWTGSLASNATSDTITTPSDMLYGTYTVSMYYRFMDRLNDGVYRTNTATASVSVIPRNLDLTQAKVSGFLTQELLTASVNAAASPWQITLYAAAQYVADADFWGLSAAAFCRVVDGAAATVSVFTIPSDGTFGTIDNGFVIPANTRSRWLMQSAIPVECNGSLWRCALPAR